MSQIEILQGDARLRLRDLQPSSVQCIVTSPPYFGLRRYTDDPAEIGREETPAEYVSAICEVMDAARVALRDDGIAFVNLGDSYAQAGGCGRQGSTSQRVGRASVDAQRKIGTQRPPPGLKPKDLIGIPWMVAFALRDAGWYLRSDCIWEKPAPMPESVNDRPTRAHEYVFLLSKSERYFADMVAVREPALNTPGGRLTRAMAGEKGRRGGVPAGAAQEGRGIDSTGICEDRNLRTVWRLGATPFSAATVGIEDTDHHAVMSRAVVERCLKIGTRPGSVVLDPFMGAGTTSLVASRMGLDSIGCELNPDSIRIAEARLRHDAPLLNRVTVR